MVLLSTYQCKAGRGGGRAWGGDLIVFVGPGVGHLTDRVLPGRGIFEHFFARRGTDVGIFDCRLGRKRLRPNIRASRTRRTVWKDLEIMEANENKSEVSGFHCVDQLNLLRYCGIKVNGSKEKPSRFLQVQLISVWLTFATITV